MRLHGTKPALRDMISIGDHIAPESDAAAARVVARTFEQAEELHQMSHAKVGVRLAFAPLFAFVAIMFVLATGVVSPRGNAFFDFSVLVIVVGLGACVYGMLLLRETWDWVLLAGGIINLLFGWFSFMLVAFSHGGG